MTKIINTVVSTAEPSFKGVLWYNPQTNSLQIFTDSGWTLINEVPESDLTELEGRVSTLEEDLASLEDLVSTIQEDITSLDSRITALETTT